MFRNCTISTMLRAKFWFPLRWKNIAARSQAASMSLKKSSESRLHEPWNSFCMLPASRWLVFSSRVQTVLVLLLFLGSLGVLLYNVLATLALPQRELDAR